MLEIFSLIYLCSQMGSLLRSKGRKPLLMQSAVVLVWFLSMLLGSAALEFYVAIADGPDAADSISLLTHYAAALTAGVAGQVFLFGIAWLLPDTRNRLMSRSKTAVMTTVIALIPFGLLGSFFLGFLCTEWGQEVYEAAVAIEEPADVSDSQTIARDRFQLEYPANWKIASNDEFFDIDRYFSIDTPGCSYVLFDIDPVGGSAEDSVRESVEYYDTTAHLTGRYLFDKWGKYDGVGIKLVGEYANEPCVVRIFSCSSDDFVFTVTEFYDTATEQLVEPGYRLVESTFEVLASESGDGEGPEQREEPEADRT